MNHEVAIGFQAIKCRVIRMSVYLDRAQRAGRFDSLNNRQLPFEIVTAATEENEWMVTPT